jgi:hypothetical protein
MSVGLFDKMVKPVYGYEIWGLGNNDILERVSLSFTVFINLVEFRKVCVCQILDMPHSFNILLNLFNHIKLHLSTTDIWKHNVYIIADNYDSLPQHNFVQNEISLTLASIYMRYLPGSP